MAKVMRLWQFWGSYYGYSFFFSIFLYLVPVLDLLADFNFLFVWLQFTVKSVISEMVQLKKKTTPRSIRSSQMLQISLEET